MNGGTQRDSNLLVKVLLVKLANHYTTGGAHINMSNKYHWPLKKSIHEQDVIQGLIL